MNVRELIEELSKLDPEAIVLSSDCCYGKTTEVEAVPGRYYRERHAPDQWHKEWRDGDDIHDYEDYYDEAPWSTEGPWEWWYGDEKPVPFNAVLID